MKKLPFFLLILIILLGFTFQNKIAFAAEFSQTIFRLNRLTPNTSISGVVCATPSSAGAGTEDRVTITFPQDFTVNTSTSNWETNTTDLPAGSVAWPGIGANANTVSGKSVTFDSGDLTNGSSLYCFNIESTNSNSGSTGRKDGTITTRNSSNSIIDSQQYGFTIITNDQVEVTATVPAQASDYITEITRIIPPLESTIISEGFESLYQIRYGTFLSYPTTITVEASWTKGTIENQSSPTVELLEYVVGSAQNAYNSTPPVIDTVNRKITWEINAFPGNLDYETVRFKLRTLNYAESQKVNYSVSSRIFFPGGVTGYKTLTSTYRKSVAPPSNITPTPTPSPAPKPPVIERIGVTEITQNEATVFVWTDKPTEKVIIYGTDIHMKDLKRVTSPRSIGSNIKISGLNVATKYYYKVYVTDDGDRTTNSDIYAFTTANPSSPLTANFTTLVVTSGNTILTNPGDPNNDFFVIPVGSPIQFKFSMLNKDSATSVDANLRSKNVLGFLSFGEKADANINTTALLETEKGVYSGSLKTNQNPGNYELYLRIYDQNGNLKEQRLAEIKAIDKFTVISNANGKPIEGARVFFYIYNPTSKTYQVIPSNLINGGNPQLTNAQGKLDVVLPQGKYKAEVSDLRHKSETVEFEIGRGENQNLPSVSLESTGIVILNIFNYYKNVVNDVFVYNTQLYSEALTGSPRFFDLVAMFSLAGVLILTIFAFSKRHRIPVTYIPSYFYYLVDRHDRSEKYIHGVIYDEEDRPVPGANVYLMDKKNEEIISHTKTNKEGTFYFKKGKSEYLLMAMARNYINSPIFEYHPRKHLKFKINLRREETGLNLLGKINHYLGHVLGISFEVLLLGSFIFEILFLNSFGVAKTLPFLLISIFNLSLWILHLHNKSHNKVVF